MAPPVPALIAEAVPSDRAVVQSYIVQAGDTLGRIAARFYGDPSRFPLIVAANAIPDPDRLLVGQSLVLPDATMAATAVSRPSADGAGRHDASERRLAFLHPGLARRARAMLDACAKAGLGVVVCEGLRTWEEQDALYARGRTVKPIGRRYWVTKARGGESYHNFGLALDIVVLDAIGKHGWDATHPGWRDAARVGKALGLAWGGDWRGFKDLPHYQWTGGLTLAECRALYADGMPAVWARVPV